MTPRVALPLTVLAIVTPEFDRTQAQDLRLNPPFALAESDVLGFEVDARGLNVAFVADGEIDGVNELYGGPTTFRSQTRLLSPPLVAGGDVTALALSPDGLHAVYRADQAVDEVQELFSVPLAGGNPVRLHAQLDLDRDVTDFAISPDSTRVVFLSNQRAVGSFELWSAPLDGSQTAVLLQGLNGGRDTLDFAISPDSSRVVARSNTSGAVELYSMPIDGSSAPIELNGALVQFGGVAEFRISPDSSRVVYLADQARAGVFELWGVPLLGSSAPVRLHARLTANADVTQWTITPNSRQVVFLADARQDEIFELRVGTFAGNRSFVVDPGLAPGGVVRDFVVSPDGHFVAFRAEVESPSQIDLFCAPLTRKYAFLERSPVVQVSGPLVSDGDVRLCEFGRDRIVYMADQEVDSRIELYSVPFDGTEPPLKLNQPLTTTGVNVILLADDGKTVLYRAEAGGAPQLFTVPADGSAAPRRVNDALVSGGSVFPGMVLHGSRVYFRADSEVDGKVELFAGFLTHPFFPR